MVGIPQLARSIVTLALLASFGHAVGHAAADVRITSMTLAPAGPIAPATGTAQITVDFEWDCDATAQPPEAVLGGDRRIDVNITAPDGVFVTGDSSVTVQYPASPCVPARKLTEAIRFNIQVTQDVPGLTAQAVTVRLSLAPANITEEGGSDEASIDVYAEPLPLVSVHVPQTIFSTNGPEDVEIDLSNVGNVPIRVDAEVNAASGKASWTPIHLSREDQQQRGILHVVPPSGSWHEYTIQAHFTPVEPSTGVEGQRTTVNLLIGRERLPFGNADARAPGPLVLAGLLGAALVAHRRRTS